MILKSIFYNYLSENEMKKRYYILFLLFVGCFCSYAQCPTAGFTLSKDTVCAGDTIVITNTSTGAVRYEWDFCAGDLMGTPAAVNMSNLGLKADPQDIEIVFDSVSTQWYGFVSDNLKDSIFRLDFGNGIDSNSTSITNVSYIYHPIGIKIFKEDSLWYGLAVSNAENNKLYKLSFGNNIKNIPVTSTINVAGLLSTPINLDILKSNDSLFVLIGNYNIDKQLTILSFGLSVNNTPAGRYINNLSIDGIYSTVVKKECDSIYCFLLGQNSNNLIRIDWEKSLNNQPFDTTDFGNIGAINIPTDIEIARDGEEWVAFINKKKNKGITRLNFGKNLNNNFPFISYIDSIPGMGNSIGIELVFTNSSWILFTPSNFQLNLYKWTFPDSCFSNYSTFTGSSPPQIVYTEGGLYPISLHITDSLQNNNIFTDTLFVKGKLKIDFDYDKTCFNDTVKFTNTSKTDFDSIISTKWNFGDNTSDSIYNVFHKYSTAGLYNIILSITSSCNSDSLQRSLKIINKPASDFTVKDSCVVNPLSFFDNTIGDTLMDYWHWNFGDGKTDSIQNVLHAYYDTNTYFVTLISGIKGCTDTISKPHNIIPKPIANFNFQKICIGDTTQFTDLSKIDSLTTPVNITSWNWNFGDSNIDTTQNTRHLYSDTLNYIVNLIVGSAMGCMDTVTKSFTIQNVNAKFSISSPVCKANAVTFKDLSLVNSDSIIIWKWNFGDGDSSALKKIIHFFSNSGFFTVNLQATSSQGCTADTSETIYVLPSPNANFVHDTVCAGKATSFSDSSISFLDTINSWKWDFGDSTALDTTQNPFHTYQKGSIYFTSLIVVTDSGCYDTSIKAIAVFSLPEVNYYYSNPCKDAPVYFYDSSSINDIVNDSIFSWKWDFDDGSSFDANKNPTHTFDNSTNYKVKLLLTSNYGCMDSLTRNIQVLPLPDINFVYDTACEDDTTKFRGISSAFPFISNWTWNFGDPSSGPNNTYKQQNAIHIYDTSKIYTVTLTAISSEQCTSFIYNDNVKVKAIPIVDFMVSAICKEDPQIFQDLSYVNDDIINEWNWNFGDGNNIDTNQNPLHTFSDTGYYNVNLNVVSFSNCTAGISRNVYVNVNPTATFSFTPQFGSPPLTVSYNNLTKNAVNYLWLFGDDSSSIEINPSHIYYDTGQYNISLIAQNIFGCRDTSTNIIRVMNPILDIAVTKVLTELNSNYVTLTVEIINVGNRDIFNVDLITGNSENTILEKWNGFLPAFTGKTNYTFFGKFSTDQINDYPFICVYARSPNGEQDVDETNNRQCSSMHSEFQLLQNFPQPTSSIVNFQFIVPYKNKLTIELYDLLGKKIITLYQGEIEKGYYQYYYNLSKISSGTYIYEVIFDGKLVGKQFLVKL